MARGRMISKGISLDEKVDALPDDTARLLFTWMIPHLDSEGRLHGDAITIKSIVFPRRSVSIKKVEEYLKKMEDLKLILRFSVNGNVYLCAPQFEKHQIGLQKDREAQSQLPPPPPELLQSYSGVGSDKVIPKIKLKSKIKYIHSSTTTFDAYKEELRTKYPILDIDEEWSYCQQWYRDNKKKIKSPSNALRNWLKIAQEKKQQGGNGGTNRGHSTELPERNSYTKRPHDPRLPG